MWNGGHSLAGDEIVWRWICSTHTESGFVVVVGVWWNIIDVIVCLLVLSRLCCGLPVGFGWSVKISCRMGVLEEQHGAVVCVFRPLPSVLVH